ncbi:MULTISPECIES: glutathione S-transferase C-terminal domain-containing protein [unclassified Nostoc]|uniref:glutathione S-transferase C-terminal domain-containing protein n=1 Tax=unclassified Nostoc TaxID=2593658 RepID=UPI0026382E7E|nr:glutathione S-transferase C-terminal domain-containing protein [Nostoc sp. S13]MDF5735334.1 hypothetical protein [Nostoc sp. S13]
MTQLNDHLADLKWLELRHPTIADVAVFPYIALAADGKISLEPYPDLRAWIEPLKHLPSFIGMIGIEKPARLLITLLMEQRGGR